MGIKAGVWIDQKKAVIVLITDLGEEIGVIESDIEKPVRPTAAARAKTKHTPNDFVAEGKLDRKRTAVLNAYYDEVLACLRDAEAVVLLGPGEAKTEFKKRIKNKTLLSRFTEPLSADKMTERQLAAKVRKHFVEGSKKTTPGKKPMAKKKVVKIVPAKRTKKSS